MVILLIDRFYPLLIILCMCYTTDGNVPKNRFQKMSFKYFNNRKIFRKKITTTQNDFEIDFQATAYMQWTVWFDFAQRNSSLQNETEDFLIINKPSETMLHSIFDVDIDTYVSKVLTSTTDADTRLTSLLVLPLPIPVTTANCGFKRESASVVLVRTFDTYVSISTSKIGWRIVTLGFLIMRKSSDSFL